MNPTILAAAGTAALAIIVIALGIAMSGRSSISDRLERYAARDRSMLIEDIRREQPDIILLDMDWEARTRSDPALSALLRAYSEISREQGIIILGRNDREKPRKGSIGSN